MTVLEILGIYFLLIFAISAFAFIGQESQTGDTFSEKLSCSVFQGTLVATVLMIFVVVGMTLFGIEIVN